jgi:hypothetical protein
MIRAMTSDFTQVLNDIDAATQDDASRRRWMVQQCVTEAREATRTLEPAPVANFVAHHIRIIDQISDVDAAAIMAALLVGIAQHDMQSDARYKAVLALSDCINDLKG